MYANIVVGTDGSDTAKIAVQHAMLMSMIDSQCELNSDTSGQVGGYRCRSLGQPRRQVRERRRLDIEP